MNAALRVSGLSDPATAPVLAGLAEEYERRYGGSGEITLDDRADFEAPDGTLLLLEEDGETLAAGALRRWSAGTAEVKRMWTAPAHRRRGHSRRVLRALEDAARGRGYELVRLQSGTAQPEALALYLSENYARIAPYGPYRDDPRCVCFEKRL